MLASHRRSTAHRRSRSRHDTAASAMSGSCMRSKSAASICRLKSELNSKRLQHATGAVLCEWGCRRSMPCTESPFCAKGVGATAALTVLSAASSSQCTGDKARTHLRLSEARGARSASNPSASSSLVLWNLPPVKVCLAYSKQYPCSPHTCLAGSNRGDALHGRSGHDMALKSRH